MSVSLKISSMLCSAVRVRRKWIIRKTYLAYYYYGKSHKYAVLPLHYCLNWGNSSVSSLPIVLTAAPCLRDEKIGTLPSFFPPPSSSPVSTQQNQPLAPTELLVVGQRRMEGRENPSLHSGRIPSKINKMSPCPGTTWQCLWTPCRKQSYLHIDGIWKLPLLAQINRKHHLRYAMLRHMYRISIYSHFCMTLCCFSPKCF